MSSTPPTDDILQGEAQPLRERSLVPAGMATILPEAARHFRTIESKLIDTLIRRGYDEIVLPTFEYLDVLAPGLEPELLEKCYKFPDRTTGRILILRPDATAQIARTVAMGMMGTTTPMRLSYRTTVFRHEPEHAGRDREIFQVGAELIGNDNAESDREIVSALIASLQRTGLRSFKVSLGHVGFFKRLLTRSGLSEEGKKRAEQAAARKDLPKLDEILIEEHVPKRAGRKILDALELSGTAEIISRGHVLAGSDPILNRALARLSHVYQSLCKDGYQDVLFLDLGEFRGFDYYDGIVFDVFAEGVGVELGGGGRYNHLIGRFGKNLASTGFALNVDRLFRGRSLSQQHSGRPVRDALSKRKRIRR